MSTRYSVHLDGGFRLTIGAVIDSLKDTSYETVSSVVPVMLEENVFYTMKMEYVHLWEEAKIQLVWESSSVPKQIVPSLVF